MDKLSDCLEAIVLKLEDVVKNMPVISGVAAAMPVIKDVYDFI